MSYHRGGHPGAVAVSFNSTSTMAPLSPSRRYSGSNGTSTGGTSSSSGSSTSKYSYRTSVGDRSGNYYSSASTTGYRTSSFTSSDSYRRPFLSPTRSVSSYSEAGSIVGSSSGTAGGLRYGSASSSSASSTASSSSSCGSRERNGLHHHPTPGSLATTTADFYAKYSPTNYIPNIYGSSGNGASSIGNGHWRPSSSSSSSGISSGVLAELHGGDEYDSCRDRRGRSYSSEASSGIGLSNNSNNSSSSIISKNGSGVAASPGLAERWSTRREAKRRSTPVLGSGGTVLAGHAQHDSAPAPSEVTLIAEGRKKSVVVPGSDSSSSSSGGNRRAAATTPGAPSSPTAAAAAAAAAASSLIEGTTVNDRNGPTDRDDEKPDSRDIDNNNAQKSSNGNNNNDRDLIENGALEQRRRRRRGNLELQRHNGDANIRDDDRDDHDDDHDRDDNNETVVARNNRDNINDESNRSERSTSGDFRPANNHHQHQHHGRASAPDESRGAAASASVNSVAAPVADIPSNVVPNAPAVTSSASSASSSSSSASSLSSASPSSENSCSSAPRAAPAVALSNGDSRGKKSSAASSSDGGGGSGGGTGAGAGGDADHHRTAYTRTKIPTNPDNTELLTNNNGQDREAAALGIVADAGRIVETAATTRVRERPIIGTAGARKSLLWTATNEIDGGDEITERKDGGRSSAATDVTNDDLVDAPGTTNGLEDGENDAEDAESGIHDLNRDEANGVMLRINGVTRRPSGTRSDDPGKASTSRKTLFGWNDPTIDDLSAPSASSSSSAFAAASSSTSTSNTAPVAVHQNVYRGLGEQIDESSNSRPPRNRLQSRRDERYGLNGLRNIGNTCFMNSVIQCLSNTRPLLEYLLNEQHLHDINTTTSSMKGALIKAFGQVIHELWEMSGDHVVNTTALKSQIQRFAPRFMGYSQQDAQEFLRYLLEGLHEDVNRVTVKPQPILTDIPDHYSDSHKAAESWKRYLRSEDSTIVDVFVGQLRSSLHCTSCDHVSVTLDPFWDLSLPIPARSGTVKLNQCLEHFTKVETMDGDEKPTCSKCQMRRKCTKSFSIQKFPKILVIHLKRFSPTERFRGKLSVLVDFPLTGLDLSAFAAPGVQGCTYNLYGVANHSGTTYSGHYTAYCKHPYSGEWHEYNDNRVSSVPARSVVSSEAYVLFYEQQPLSPHL